MIVEKGMKKLDQNIKLNRKGKPIHFYGCCFPLQSSHCYFVDEVPENWVCYPLVDSGYRVNLGYLRSFYSIFSTSHNEFLLIWSDLLPLLIYITMSIVHFTSTHFANAHHNLKLLEIGVFAGIIACRAGSTIYHIFNCANLWASRNLIQIDLIGITFMSLVSPYFYILGDESIEADVVFNNKFIVYCYLLFGLQTICLLVFLYNLIFGESNRTSILRQPLLVLLAGVGNWAGARIMINNNKPTRLRVHCGIAVVGLLVGYVLCFLNQYPERLFKSGVSDGKLWNSHVLWHLILFTGQMCFLTIPFYFS